MRPACTARVCAEHHLIAREQLRVQTGPPRQRMKEEHSRVEGVL